MFWENIKEAITSISAKGIHGCRKSTLYGTTDRRDNDHRTDTDDDSKHRQKRTHLVAGNTRDCLFDIFPKH